MQKSCHGHAFCCKGCDEEANKVRNIRGRGMNARERKHICGDNILEVDMEIVVLIVYISERIRQSDEPLSCAEWDDVGDRVNCVAEESS